MDYAETQKNLLEALNGLTTAENAETIAKMKTLIGNMATEHDAVVQDARKSKDALVKAVQTMPVQQFAGQAGAASAHADPVHEAEPLSIDAAIDAALREVQASATK